MTTTAKDIAKRLGLSRPSVTRILANKEGYRYSTETRQRVLETAKEMNYQPNAIARGLAGKRMNTLGIVLTSGYASLLSPYFSLVVGSCARISSSGDGSSTSCVGRSPPA